jgi:hypothetical protein
VVAESASDSSNGKFVDVHCPAGKRVVGGGAALIGASASVALDENLPLNATTWRATAFEVSASWSVRAYAICAVVAA